MIENLVYFLSSPGAWAALLSWPTFSFTSYRIVSSMKRQQISPKTVIDVGANIGQFAVACAKTFPNITVHSFEPHPQCIAKLRRHMAGFRNAHIHPIALGERDGSVQFHVNSHSHSSSILSIGERHRKAFPNAREISTIDVPLSTLDRAMESVTLERPLLLKLDIQGYEPQVLQGASATLMEADYVLLEASFRPLYEGESVFMEIVRTMEKRGFDFLRPLGWLVDPRSGEVLQMDALFVKSNRRGQCES